MLCLQGRARSQADPEGSVPTAVVRVPRSQARQAEKGNVPPPFALGWGLPAQQLQLGCLLSPACCSHGQEKRLKDLDSAQGGDKISALQALQNQHNARGQAYVVLSQKKQ